MAEWQPWPPPFDDNAHEPIRRHALWIHAGPMGMTIYKTFDVDGVIYQTMTGNGGGSWRIVEQTAPPSEGE